MIDNSWIIVTQLGSVLAYVGTAFWLYRLLAAQKDATIEAKDSTIENLQIQLREAESKVPDTLVALLEDRLDVSQKELERLKHDKDGSLAEVQSLRELKEAFAKIMADLYLTIEVFQLISRPANEDYKDFVIDICGNIDEAVKTICVSESLTDVASKHGKTINEVSHADVVGAMVKGKEEGTLVISKFVSLGSYVFIKDDTIMITNAMLKELTQKHEGIIRDI